MNDNNDQNPRPFDKVSEGDLSIPLWKQEGQHGPYLTSSGVEKTYQDRETREFKTTRSLRGPGEHYRAARLQERAGDRIAQFREAMKAERKQDQERER